MALDYSPTVRRRRLAAELRRLREISGLKLEDVAAYLDCRHPKISRIEKGRGAVSVGDVRLMLDFYGVTGVEADRLIQLARDSGKKSWWHSYSDVLPDWLATYVGLEAEAAECRTYEGEVVNGLLQTQEYATAVTLATVDAPSVEEVDRRVELRLKRQRRLHDEQPLELHVVHSEAALRRPVGGRAVMGAQLRHLAQLAELPNVTLRVLPISAGAHPAMLGPFVMLRFPEASDRDVVYLETQVGGLYLEKSEEIADYSRVFDHLCRKAVDPRGTIQLIHRIAEEL
ncbi:helix-turn-helix domain-containing protein [Kutzneria kofuensis]|uniref:Transcriptional regulator with XRE-family HTH domain n=1 Tax=Kutzneria kofuensis TaxID=103725 RepID=A0A7W9NE33_9PSEU|nr:helix-turn-helix transcriptional regulator [Kutzneria kofuensis]MBB5889852.1 transcriptional regulator with XRE-family HTH domain [Kutzneria kofuensis]